MPSESLLDLTLPELRERLGDAPAYRADQIWQAIYSDLAEEISAITTLPKAMRKRLGASLPLPALDPIRDEETADGQTCKTLYRLADGETIESVTMGFHDRATICVSSQVGCAIGCPFCATGRSGFVRDLSAGEIVAQVLRAAQLLRSRGERLSNVVYMGMGEPLLNYDAVLRSIRILNDPEGFGLGARSFTVSTAGIVPGIDRLANEGLQVNLAVSLHAADDALRSRLVPVNRQYPIAELLDACRRYAETTRRRITFEIAMIEEVNDRPEQASAVASLLSGLLCHVNLIPYNPPQEAKTRRSSKERMSAFAEVLSKAGLPVTIRLSVGSEIQAGCGQLRRRDR